MYDSIASINGNNAVRCTILYYADGFLGKLPTNHLRSDSKASTETLLVSIFGCL